MNLENKDIGLKLVIDDKLIEYLKFIGQEHYPNEFGGFLIGNYSADFQTLIISETILPNKYKSTKYLFERDTFGIDGKLKKFYAEKPSRYYVGEWHTHPDNLPIPSATDINAMNSIINHEKVLIKNPILLIIGYCSEVKLGFYVSFKNKLYRYEQ